MNIVTQEFSVTSADGTPIRGQVDRPDGGRECAVLFVHGTGLFDRNAWFGRSGTSRDLIFKDLSARMNAAGLTTIRYDMRGVTYTGSGPPTFIAEQLGRRTTTTSRDDLAAVLAWARDPSGLAIANTILFAHSEGMWHVARLADTGVPSPTAVIGMGAPLDSPQSVLRWQLVDRDAESLLSLDREGSGRVTNEEIEARFAKTPSGAWGTVAPFLHPSGFWTKDEIQKLRTNQRAVYEKTKADLLKRADDEIYPMPDRPFASFEWWKSFFIDDCTAAARLSKWQTRYLLHYGEYDSQVPPAMQKAVAAADPKTAQYEIVIHPQRGHTLGEYVLAGPVDPVIADQLVEDARRAGEHRL